MGLGLGWGSRGRRGMCNEKSRLQSLFLGCGILCLQARQVVVEGTEGQLYGRED